MSPFPKVGRQAGEEVGLLRRLSTGVLEAEVERQQLQIQGHILRGRVSFSVGAKNPVQFGGIGRDRGGGVGPCLGAEDGSCHGGKAPLSASIGAIYCVGHGPRSTE